MLTPPPQFPSPLPPVPLLPGNTKPNDSLLVLYWRVASTSSQGPVGALSGGTYANGSKIVHSGVVEDKVEVCTGVVNGLDKLLPETPLNVVDGFTIETGVTGTGMTRATREGTLEDEGSIVKRVLLAALGGVSPVSCEYKSFQYFISL